MTTTAELACKALFALATDAYTWGSTPSRRLKLWNEVTESQCPALFQFEGGHDNYAWSSMSLLIRSVEVKWFVYVKSSAGKPGAPQLRAILDALDTAMRPSGSDMPTGLNTLGGLVYCARIKGVPIKEPGDLDGDGLAIIEVELILP